MKDITNLLNSWRKYLQKDCSQGCAGSGCRDLNHCSRMKMAQVWAYRDAVIPNEYRNFTIDDFTGVKNGRRLLPTSLVQRAREAVTKYCWNGIEEGSEYDAIEWLNKTAMPHRREFGTNLVIYGNPWHTEPGTNGLPKTFRLPLGRTMLAAIVLKEAINLRLLSGTGHLSDRYGWINYQALTTMLMEKANGRKDFDDDVWHYESADWLVLDGLEVRKDAGTAFRASVLDQFFTVRLQAGRPNILVFQDDISKFGVDEIREHFGSQMSNQIVSSSKTHHVVLLDK